MTRIKAIETRYKGYRFRSRLEARWAVFFDALGVPYEYEPQGFNLGGRSYLPDFWLPVQGCWIEIKGQEPDARESALAEELAKQRRQPVYVLFGPIPLPTDDTLSYDGNEPAFLFDPQGWDCCHKWCECLSCGRVGLEFEGRAGRLHQHVDGPRCKWFDEQPRYDDYAPGGLATPRLIRAYEAGRGARFEYGESPQPHRMGLTPEQYLAVQRDPVQIGPQPRATRPARDQEQKEGAP